MPYFGAVKLGLTSICRRAVMPPLESILAPPYIGFRLGFSQQRGTSMTFACINIDGASSRNSRVFPLLKHDKSKPFEGFHRAFKPKAVKGN